MTFEEEAQAILEHVEPIEGLAMTVTQTIRQALSVWSLDHTQIELTPEQEQQVLAWYQQQKAQLLALVEQLP